MHTTIWSNHSQCISLYIYKTLRSFWDLNNLDFCTVSTLTCHDENSFLKKKSFVTKLLGAQIPSPLLQGNYDKIKHCIHSSLQLSQLQIRPNKGDNFDIESLSFIRKSSYSEPNFTFWSQCYQSMIAIAEVMGRGISCPWCPKKSPIAACWF